MKPLQITHIIGIFAITGVMMLVFKQMIGAENVLITQVISYIALLSISMAATLIFRFLLTSFTRDTV